MGINQLGEILLAASTTSTSNPLWYLGVATVLALVPIVIGLFTSFVKISVVLGLLKSALGTQHAPSGMVTMALSLAITGYTMFPVMRESMNRLPQTNLQNIATHHPEKLIPSLAPAAEPWTEFIARHSGKRELAVLLQFNHHDASVGPHPPSSNGDPSNLPLTVLLPAFLLTELKEAFAMGFAILLPCLVIDLIVANILMGLGMMMVTPTLITLPLKLFLFVISDAWLLITQGLINSYTW